MFYLINKKSEKVIGTLIVGAAAALLVGSIILSVL